MTTDPIVTHEDLDVIDTLAVLSPSMFRSEGAYEKVQDFLARARAAAEADTPPLPEGWYLWRDEHGGTSTAVYVKGGRISRWDDGDGLFGQVIPGDRDRLTPLRPTVTEADVEKAAYAIFRERDGIRYEGCTRDACLGDARAALAAAGVVIEP